jgi:hypothetical protein
MKTYDASKTGLTSVGDSILISGEGSLLTPKQKENSFIKRIPLQFQCEVAARIKIINERKAYNLVLKKQFVSTRNMFRP